MNKGKHLTYEDRLVIEKGIQNGSDKTSIGTTLGKSKSTIGKEIKLHREISYEGYYIVECKNIRSCSHSRKCLQRKSYALECIDYELFVCPRRDRSPGACNGCEKYQGCRYKKYRYDAIKAQNIYEKSLIDSRVGENLTEEDVNKIGNIIAPLIKQGHSPYRIVKAHPEIGITEKSLYNYIESGIFRSFGILDISLRRKVGRKLPRKQSKSLKKRQDKQYLVGRKMDDFLNYTKVHPDALIVEMDTVYNDETKGPFIQTFKFVKFQLFFAIFHTEKTAATMTKGVEILYNILGPELFSKYCEVILTDRGSEFSNAKGFEFDCNGEQRCHTFYCDAMCSWQKGSGEEEHTQLRFICPNEVDLYEIGLTSQEPLNLIVSHINSSISKILEGKTPFEYTAFLAPELLKKLLEYGICVIPNDNIILTPKLILKFKK